MQFVFFGTSHFAVSVLSALETLGMRPSLIVTETDKPKGRGQALGAPEAKQYAISHAIPVYQPPRLKEKAAEERLRSENAAVFLVAEYGKMIPDAILSIPKFGTQNIHPSLLPKYRGPSPIQSAILADDPPLGVSLIELDSELDHGPIIASRTRVFTPWPPSYAEAAHQLATDGATLFAEIFQQLPRDIPKTPQNHTLATFTKKFNKSDGVLNLSDNGYQNWLRFLAFSETIGITTDVKRKDSTIRIKITDAKYENGIFIPTQVVPPGKRKMPYADFLRGL